MPPTLALDAHLAGLARRAALVTSSMSSTSPSFYATHYHEKRGLSVNHTQGVTLGVIAAYVVVIALLWNLPYIRWVLWPFKVRLCFVISCCIGCLFGIVEGIWRGKEVMCPLRYLVPFLWSDGTRKRWISEKMEMTESDHGQFISILTGCFQTFRC
jgi:hypothetical protein